MSKSWWKSKTVWFNVAAGGAVLLDWMGQQKFGFTTSPYFAMAVAAVNIVLRKTTVHALTR